MTNGAEKGLRTWLEIDKKAIAKNYTVLRSLTEKHVKFMAVVKSNAYGHGLIDFSREAVDLGADFLGVDSIVEGLALRSAGIKTPILVLGYTLPENVLSAVEAGISITISSAEQLKKVIDAKIDGKLSVHIKVDTGMHRQGFLPAELQEVVLSLQNSSLAVEGLYTHFASAKNPAFPQDTNDQIEKFRRAIRVFKERGLSPICHASATAGLILFPDAHFDMVRVGIGLYGFWPARQVEEYAKDKLRMEKVLSWRTIISEVKTVPAGDRLGYDFTEKLERDTRVAVCPIGYWHGFDRHLSSVGRVIVRGKKARVLGRVSMDMITIDITDIPDAVAMDEVTVIGKSQGEEITAEEHGEICETSYYETVTRINPLIKRIYI